MKTFCTDDRHSRILTKNISPVDLFVFCRKPFSSCSDIAAKSVFTRVGVKGDKKRPPSSLL